MNIVVQSFEVNSPEEPAMRTGVSALRYEVITNRNI